MSNVTATIRKVESSVTIGAGQDPLIYNVLVPTAGVEISQALNADTRKFSIGVRDGKAIIQLAFNATESATNFITIPYGAIREFDGILFTGTLYFQLNTSGKVIEILEWT